MTCNLATRPAVIPALAKMVIEREPDIVVLQEIDDSPRRYIWPERWHMVTDNELALASRWPIAEIDRFRHLFRPRDVAGVHFLVTMPDRAVHVFNLHLRSPRRGFEAVLDRRTKLGTEQLDAILEVRAIESEAVAEWISRFDGPKIVLGDFNMPSESSILRRDWNWLNDAFGGTGLGFGFTKISAEGHLAYGTRIDHVLYDESYSCVRCWVDGDVGSDHLPLFADRGYS
jgi:endonuclease/exonuclease/phosphatase (EEP) superfamily protein YafD